MLLSNYKLLFCLIGAIIFSMFTNTQSIAQHESGSEKYRHVLEEVGINKNKITENKTLETQNNSEHMLRKRGSKEILDRLAEIRKKFYELVAELDEELKEVEENESHDKNLKVALLLLKIAIISGIEHHNQTVGAPKSRLPGSLLGRTASAEKIQSSSKVSNKKDSVQNISIKAFKNQGSSRGQKMRVELLLDEFGRITVEKCESGKTFRVPGLIECKVGWGQTLVKGGSVQNILIKSKSAVLDKIFKLFNGEGIAAIVVDIKVECDKDNNITIKGWHSKYPDIGFKINNGKIYESLAPPKTSDFKALELLKEMTKFIVKTGYCH